MITESRGNLLDAEVDALVNTVNTVGVMGKGIALQFRRAYPAMYGEYTKAAKAGDIHLGRMHVWANDETLTGPRYVINFPTKSHWKARSRIVDIQAGLADLATVVQHLGITSIAIPPLGCGNGGLSWAQVMPLITRTFAALPDLDVHVYPPAGPSDPSTAQQAASRRSAVMAVGTTEPFS